MTNKPFVKLLSVILTITICLTAVLGCLITANAQDGPSYVISQVNVTSGAEGGSVTASFNIPDGMAAGIFIIDNPDNWYSDVEVTVNSATAVSGTFNAEDFSVDVSKEDGIAVVAFNTANAKLYTTVVFKFEFLFTNALTQTTTVSVSDLDFSGLYDQSYTEFAGANGAFLVGCTHEFAVSGNSVYTDEVNGYAVYENAVCVKCGEAKNSAQVKPIIVDNSVVSEFETYDDEFWLQQVKNGVTGKSADDPFIVSTAGQFASVAAARLTAPTTAEITDNGYTVLRELSKNTTDGLFYWQNQSRDTGYYLDTTGLYFKVADNVSAFYINGGETVANLTSAAEVKAWFEDANNKKSQWWSGKEFKGTFDGNGVTVYGIYCTQSNASTFHSVFGATVKNLTVKNSYFKSSSVAAPIMGNVGWNRAIEGQSTLGAGQETLSGYGINTIENCTVANNYVATTGTTYGPCGLAGDLKNHTTSSHYVNNCLVYGNKFDNIGSGKQTGLIAGGGSSLAPHLIENTICLGITPYTPSAGWYLRAIDNEILKNIYTDQSFEQATNYSQANCVRWGLNVIEPEQLLGSNAMTTTAACVSANKTSNANSRAVDLDWNTSENPDGIWYVGRDGQYPTLLKGFDLSPADITDVDWDLIGANIEYKDDGSYALNFHIVPTYENQDIKLYVAKSDSKNGFIKLDTYTASPFENEFAGAKMFTVDTLSARDIETDWLATIVTKSSNGDEIVYGKTESISISKIANAVISGDAHYDDTASAEEKAQDIKVAAAIINYSNAVKNISNEAPAEPVVSEYSDPKTAAQMTGSGTADDPYIVETAGQFAAVARGYVESDGKYFKVADGIDAFYLNGGETVANMKTAEQVRKYFTTNGGNIWWTPTKDSVSQYFKGNFDGNGVTIYGLYTGSTAKGNPQDKSALFPLVDGSAVIKNINLKNSYIEGNCASGLIAGSGSTAGVITIENCSVEDCYIRCNRNASDYRSYGGILLASTSQTLHAYNCIVVDNLTSFAYNNTTELMPVISSSSNSSTVDGVKIQSDVSNIIAIGASVCGQGWALFCIGDGQFKNVYTDSDLADLKAKNSGNTDTTLAKYNVRSVSKQDLYGIKAMQTIKTLADSATATGTDDFDWNNIWAYGAEGQAPVLALRKNESTEKKAVYWTTNTYDDDFIVHEDQTGDGSKDNPYIIFDAEDLASVVAARVVNVLGKDKGSATPIDTTGVYFKVADNINAFYMANDDATYGAPNEWDTIEKVKAALSNKANVYKWWVTNTFNGNFDGNGATVYGLYADKETAALFHKVGTSATIKNITVANSYFKSSSQFAAGLVGATSTNSGTLTIENCAVVNNYIHSNSTTTAYYGGAGAIVGNNYWGPTISIDNCLVYGNDIANDSEATKITTPGLVGFAAKGTISNTIAIGVNPYIIADAANSQFNSLKGGAKATNFTNVYTDADITVAEALYGIDYADSNIKQLTLAQMQGAAAKENMPALAWDSVWFAGKNGKYPSFVAPNGVMPDDVQSIYDAMVLDSYDSYGDSAASFGMYGTALTLKTNPYISFTFEFGGEYQRNENVVVTFKSGGDTIATTTAAQMTNSEDAGRFHLYRLKEIPVKALCEGITVTVSYGGTDYNFGTYSVEGFALNALNANAIDPSEYYLSRYEAAKALLFYSQMLAERYGA